MFVCVHEDDAYKRLLNVFHDSYDHVADTSLIESNDEDDMGGPPQRSSSPPQYEQQQAKPGRMAKMEAAPEASDDGGAALMGYNAAEFKHLNVSDDIRELFKLIGRYQVGGSCHAGE